METDELVSSLELAISSLQKIGKSLQDGQCVDSTEILSVTETLPHTVCRLSAVGTSKAVSLFPKLGSALSAILPTDSLAAVRLPALQCLVACRKYANEIVSIEKTKKRATSFAREHLDHINISVRSSCITWLSYFPALFKPGADGERFCSQWRETMGSTLSSLQICLTSLSHESLSGALSVESPLPLPDPLDSSQTARRVDSLFDLALSLLSQNSTHPVPIPVEAIVYIITLAVSRLHTDEERGPIREVQCSAWRFLEKLSGLLPSCLLPLTQPISALFAQSMATLSPRSVSISMLRGLSSWLEGSGVSVLPTHLHQFLHFLEHHSSLRTDTSTGPLSGQKRHRVSTEFSVDREAVLLANQCLATSASLIKNCVTEVSVQEYDTFMSHLTHLLRDYTQLQTQFPSDPLLPQYSALLYSLLSDSVLYSHPLSSHAPALLPHFTLGLHAPHAPTRQACRTAISLIELMTHPTLPPIRPRVSCYTSLPPTCPLQVPHGTGDRSPPTRTDTPPIPDSTPDTTDVPAVNSFTEDRDTEYQPPEPLCTERAVASPACHTASATGISDTPIETALPEERPAKHARMDSTDLGNESLSAILSTFVEEGPDV